MLRAQQSRTGDSQYLPALRQNRRAGTLLNLGIFGRLRAVGKISERNSAYRQITAAAHKWTDITFGTRTYSACRQGAYTRYGYTKQRLMVAGSVFALCLPCPWS